MELELQEAPERFYFTKKEKKGYLEEKNPTSLPCAGLVLVTGGWDGWNQLHHLPDWVFPRQ